MRRNGFALASLLLFHLFSFSIQLDAQSTTSGGLTGVVSDPGHAIVPSAKVEIRDNTRGTLQTAKTDSDGVYRFFFLAPGRYTLTVSHPGFRDESQELSVLLGPPGTRNITLKLAGASVTVKVTDEIPLLQAENGDVSITMSQKQISEVPNPGNDLTGIAQTAPGAVMNTDTIGFGGSGNFSILGMPAVSNLFTINGMNDNNPMFNVNNSGVLGMLLGQNGVQEATIVTNGYSAQFGGAAGASVNYITKSGSNLFHGNAQYYWNGTVLNANDWIDNAFGNPRPPDSAHQWAGSIGGPIKKDKLFFFVDSEGMNILMPAEIPVVLPSKQFEEATMANIDSRFGMESASHKFYRQVFDLYDSAPRPSKVFSGDFSDSLGCYGWVNPNDPNDLNGVGVSQPCAVHYFKNIGTPARQWLGSGRLDWNWRAQDRVFLLIRHDNGHLANYIDPVSPVFTSYKNQPTWQGQLNETHTLSPTAANQFLLAGTYIKSRLGVADSAKALATFPVALSWWPASPAFSALGGLDFAFGLPARSTTISYQISDDFTKTHEKHKLDVGFNFERTYWKGWGANWSGVPLLVPLSLNAFFFGGVDPSSPKTDFSTTWQTFPKSSWNNYWFYSLGFYAQEEWRARPNLTLTLGVRADHQSNPVCKAGCFSRMDGPFRSVSHDPNQPYSKVIRTGLRQAYENTDALMWLPRFSFAWQPLGISRKTVLRGGVGVFYDPLPNDLGITSFSWNSPGINTYSVSGYNLAPDETNSLSRNAAASNGAFQQGFASNETLAQIQATDANFTVPLMNTQDRIVHSPQFQKWSLQLQQSLGGSRSLTIGYFGNHGLHELDVSSNPNAFGFGSFPTKPCESPPVQPCYDTRFGVVDEAETNAVSNYHGVVTSFEQRFSGWGGGILQANYTYGHALDMISNEAQFFTYGSFNSPQDSRHLRDSYGPADYDVRHSFTANYVWELPLQEILRGHGKEALVKGWQVSGVILAHTGFPYSVRDNGEEGLLGPNNINGPVYAVPAAPLGKSPSCGKSAAIPSSPVPCLPPQVQSDGSPNPSALFIQSGCMTDFNAGNLPGANGACSGQSVKFSQGRNHFRGPGFVNVDFAVMKNTKIPRRENWQWSMGLQFFNFFNHPNFGLPDTGLADSSLGQIFYLEQAPTSILGSTAQANVARRMIQLKFEFRL
jgi:hypothetical protein